MAPPRPLPKPKPRPGLPSGGAAPRLASVDYLAEARRVIGIEIEGLEAIRSRLGDSFAQAVRLAARTLERRGKIVVAGVGKSGNIGRKIAATLTSTGSTSVALDSVDALHGDLGILSDGDLMLLLSYSGESEELLPLLPALREFEVARVAITGAPGSTVGRESEVVLDCRVPREACPYNLAPTASATATLAMGDALAMAVMKARGFTQEDYARHHPSGAIGRALTLKVGEVMRRGGRNPLVSQSATVEEALRTIGQAKSGCVVVSDAQGRLAGIFTDGDLRRLLLQGGKVLDRPLAEVMNRDPVRISSQAPAVEAMDLIRERHIDEIIAVDEEGRPVGLIDSQDLPPMKRAAPGSIG